MSIFLLNYWLNKPEKDIINKRRRRFISFERNGFIFTFIHIFFKMFFLFFIFDYTDLFYCIQFDSNYYYLPYIIGIVLFFDLWIGLRRIYKIKLVQILGYFLLLVSLSLIFISFRPYNLESLIETGNKRNKLICDVLEYKCDIEMPEVEIEFFQPSYSIENKVYLPKIHGNVNQEIWLNDFKKPIKDLRHFLKSYDEFNSHLPTSLVIYADKEIKMKTFFKISNSLYGSVYDIKLVTTCSSYKCKCNVVRKYIRIPEFAFFESFYIDKDDKYPPPPPPPEYFRENYNPTLKIVTNATDSIHLNDTIISLNQLNEIITNNLDTNSRIQLIVDEETSYNIFMKIISSTRNIIYKKRNYLSIELYQEDYWSLERQQRKMIQKKVPYNLLLSIKQTSN